MLLFKLLSIIYNRFDDLVDKAQVAVCSVLVQMWQLRCCRASPVSGECGQSSGFPCKRGWPSARLRLSSTSRSIRSASAYFLWSENDLARSAVLVSVCGRPFPSRGRFTLRLQWHGRGRACGAGLQDRDHRRPVRRRLRRAAAEQGARGRRAGLRARDAPDMRRDRGRRGPGHRGPRGLAHRLRVRRGRHDAPAALLVLRADGVARVPPVLARRHREVLPSFPA